MIPALLSIILYCASHPTPKAALIKIFLGGGCAGTGIVLLYLTARVEVRCTAIADVSGMCVWTQGTTSVWPLPLQCTQASRGARGCWCWGYWGREGDKYKYTATATATATAVCCIIGCRLLYSMITLLCCPVTVTVPYPYRYQHTRHLAIINWPIIMLMPLKMHSGHLPLKCLYKIYGYRLRCLYFRARNPL
jgi:hypothetical protein